MIMIEVEYGTSYNYFILFIILLGIISNSNELPILFLVHGTMPTVKGGDDSSVGKRIIMLGG